MHYGELGDWKSPSVVQGQPQSSGRGFRGSSSQKLKSFGERRGNTRYRVTQITYPVPDLVWAIWFDPPMSKGWVNPTRWLSSAYLWKRERYNGVFLWLFLNMVPLRNAAFNESISSTGNPRWRPEKGKSLNANGHFRGNIVYITIPVTHYIETYIQRLFPCLGGQLVECHWYLYHTI